MWETVEESVSWHAMILSFFQQRHLFAGRGADRAVDVKSSRLEFYLRGLPISFRYHPYDGGDQHAVHYVYR